jgi:hypothetical protein
MNFMLKDINVIASFNKSRVITPVKFKFSNEANLNIVIKIDKVINIRIENLSRNKFLIYSCSSFMEGNENL